MKTMYFLIESGKVLEMVRDHIQSRIETYARNKALLDDLGLNRYWHDIMDGTVAYVDFGNNQIHKDFKKPDRKGRSYPKKNTEWDKRFKEQVGYDRTGFGVAKALGIPDTIQYEKDGLQGSSVIASGFLSGVGFLYLSPEGPYVLYTPDVQAKVREYEDKGYKVDDACKNLKAEFEGCRLITEAEWKFIVAKHELEKEKT